jgi:hypothetical protein
LPGVELDEDEADAEEPGPVAVALLLDCPVA